MPEENEGALLVVETRRQAELEVAANYHKATSVAGLCKEIVLKTAVIISGKKYVPAASWEAIAVAHGYVVSTRDVEYVKGSRDEQGNGFAGGFRCIGEIKNVVTGVVIATAEGFVSEDETTWFGGEVIKNGQTFQVKKRSDSAIRAMVQTRSAGRVCKQAFAHVVVLMNAGLSTTPAEEIIDTDEPFPDNTGEPIYDWRNIHIHFGKKHGPGCDEEHPNGKQLGELSDAALKWYQNKYEPNPDNAQDVRLRRALDMSLGKIPPDLKPAEDAPDGDEPPA